MKTPKQKKSIVDIVDNWNQAPASCQYHVVWGTERNHPKQKVYRVSLRGTVVMIGQAWWVRITARNGKIIAHSETYPTKRTALKTARALCGAKLVMEEKQ